MKKSELPKPFGKDSEWRVKDKNGNEYNMKKFPSDVFIKNTPNGPELHMVYKAVRSTPNKEKGFDIPEPKKEKVNPF